MMDDQQGRPALFGASAQSIDRSLGSINRSDKASDLARILDLQSVQRGSVIRHFSDAEIPVEIFRNLREWDGLVCHGVVV
jgi:hypothetical protein